jgi:acetyl-CoA carboxylase biotin carboxyl carrier protein
MKISFLKKLIRMVESSEIEEIELRRWWTKVRITKTRTAAPRNNSNGVVEVRLDDSSPVQEAKPEDVPADENLVEVKSPMVGTFYRTPSPGAKPYAEVGDRIEVGQVLCIIEAMKLMNEIESEVSGSIVKILVDNEQPVEFGQVLFLVSPA